MSTEAVSDGVPLPIAAGISTGGFFWQPTDEKILPEQTGQPLHLSSKAAVHATPGGQAFLADVGSKINAPQVRGIQIPRLPKIPGEPPLLTLDDGNVLALLQKRTFAGKGFNTIFRPRSNNPIAPAVPGTNDNVLELNLTQETLTFTESLGDVPNRGFQQQEDLILKGVSYVQKINDITNPKTGKADGKPSGIHFEPGVWLAVPKCSFAPPNQVATLARMASIPHGTTINAQGVQPNAAKPKSGTPTQADIPKVDITPTFIGTAQKVPFPSQTFSNIVDDRIPGDLTPFDNPQTHIKDLLADPNSFLRRALADQAAQGIQVLNFHKVDITTLQTPTLGGGTANIAFLGGTSTSPLLGGTNENAFAVQMTATFWFETVQAKINIAGGHDKPQTFQPGGPLGPTFIAPPTVGMQDAKGVPVTWTQIQYSQNVMLNFAPLSWPHVSVATLAETTTFDLKLQLAA